MRHIHPFPARMAPDLALRSLLELPSSATVLDPMAGSGMVLAQAARQGLRSKGVDLDPLACLIAKTASTRVSEENVTKAVGEILHFTRSLNVSLDDLPWMDQRTKEFILFWYDAPQIEQLSKLSFAIHQHADDLDTNSLDVLKVSISRLIVTKEPKASRARDTAHSRPHRTIVDNPFNVLSEFSASVEFVLRTLKPKSIRKNSAVSVGDARKLDHIESESIDRIVTSPPYLNAIDYMRGHRISLVWFGYRVGELSEIRGRSIGAEKILQVPRVSASDFLSGEQIEKLGNRKTGMINRYIEDMHDQVREAARVLKPSGSAVYVIGDSNLSGVLIKNSQIFISAAEAEGLSVSDKVVREIPESRRYLPLGRVKGNSLEKRMRFENVITVKKAA